MAVDVDQIQFGRTMIVYEIVRSGARQTVEIVVNPDATVTVAAPKGVWRRRIRDAVGRKAAWVVEKQDVVSRRDRATRKRLVSGETLPYLGREYQLKIERVRRSDVACSVRMERGQLRVGVGYRWSSDRRAVAVPEALRGWYREHAAQHISEAAERFARRLGVQYESVRLLDMKTRWGSGGTSGRLRFNWRIVMAPRKLMEYVVAHELCHLVHPHHSPEFWRMLGTAIPDYEARRIELAHLGPRLDI